VDKHLRELEREAQTDLSAAQRLIHRLKSLVEDRWGVVLCPLCKGAGNFQNYSTFPRHDQPRYCTRCNGNGALRVRLADLEIMESLRVRDAQQEEQVKKNLKKKSSLIDAFRERVGSGEIVDQIHDEITIQVDTETLGLHEDATGEPGIMPGIRDRCDVDNGPCACGAWH